MDPLTQFVKIGIITQVRATSTRLPAKVLLSVRGRTYLEHHLDRLRRHRPSGDRGDHHELQRRPDRGAGRARPGSRSSAAARTTC